jgi:hypothetical protein
MDSFMSSSILHFKIKQKMKKLLIAAGFVLAMTGLATAQTTPAKTQTKTVKTEKSVPAKGSTAKHAHHAKKHHAMKPAK